MRYKGIIIKFHDIVKNVIITYTELQNISICDENIIDKDKEVYSIITTYYQEM